MVVASTALWAADVKKEFKYTAKPGSTVTISNTFGPVVVSPVAGRQVTITATTHSDKVRVDSSQMGNRIRAVTNFLQQVNAQEGQVNYEVQVPADCNVFIQNGDGMTKLSGVRSDVGLDTAMGGVEVSDVNNSHVHVQTLDAPITLTNVHSEHVEIVSNGGNVRLTNVTGGPRAKVSVSTDTGDISYDGDFAGGGDYSFMNHNGKIDVTLPATASVDLNATSKNGTVQNDFPPQPKLPTAAPLVRGSSPLLGVTPKDNSHSNLSEVKLSSFSGTIRVRKR
jgi:hypothetical protein